MNIYFVFSIHLSVCRKNSNKWFLWRVYKQWLQNRLHLYFPIPKKRLNKSCWIIYHWKCLLEYWWHKPELYSWNQRQWESFEWYLWTTICVGIQSTEFENIWLRIPCLTIDLISNLLIIINFYSEKWFGNWMERSEDWL